MMEEFEGKLYSRPSVYFSGLCPTSSLSHSSKVTLDGSFLLWRNCFFVWDLAQVMLGNRRAKDEASS